MYSAMSPQSSKLVYQQKVKDLQSEYQSANADLTYVTEKLIQAYSWLRLKTRVASSSLNQGNTGGFQPSS